MKNKKNKPKKSRRIKNTRGIKSAESKPSAKPFVLRARSLLEESLPPLSPLRGLENRLEKNLNRPKVSVVIVNRNGVDFLTRCLFSLKTQTYPLDEIIVVDNGSTDESVSFIRSNYPQVKILESQENLGFATGCNLGTRYAAGDLVVFLNNDAVVTPQWLGRLVAEFRAHWPRAGAVTSRARSNQKTTGDRSGGSKVVNILGSQVEGFSEDERTVFYPEGYAFIYPRFLALEGPFDPDYFIYQEDLYFGWKLQLAGKQVRVCPEAKVFHETGGTASRLPGWKVVYFRNRNRWLNLFLFYGTGNLLRVFPWIVLDAAAQLVKGLTAGFNQFFGVLFAALWILTHPIAIHRKRKVIQQKRKISDGRIISRLSGRVVDDEGAGSRFLNLISLSYCRFVGLEVIEFQDDGSS